MDIKRKHASVRTVLAVLFLCLAWQIPCINSQVLNATLEITNNDTVYLTDKFLVEVNLTLGTQDLDSVYAVIDLPEELQATQEIQSDNSTLYAGSNIEINGTKLKVLTDTGCTLSVFNITIANQSISDPVENQITFNCDVYVHKSSRKGETFEITGLVSYSLRNSSSSPSSLAASITLQYGGPEVEISLNSAGYPVDGNASQQSVTIGRKLEISADFHIPAEWTFIEDVMVHLDLTSTNVSVIPVEFLQCEVTASSVNVTFSNTNTTNVIDFERSNDTISPIHHRSRRTPAGSSEAKLVWTIGNITNSELDDIYLFFKIVFFLLDNSELVDGTFLKSALSIDMNGVPIDLVDYWMVVRTPQLSITKTVAKTSRSYENTGGHEIQTVRFTTRVSHEPGSMAEAYNVLIVDDVEDLYVKYDSSSIRPAVGTDGLRPSLTQISLMHKELAVGDTMELSYVAYLDDEKAEEKLETPFTFEAQVIWESVEPDEVIPGHPGRDYGPITAEACIEQTNTYKSDLVLNHGIAALFFFVFMLIGFLLVVIIFLIWVKCCRRAPYAVVNPTRSTRAAKNTGLIINPGSNKKSALESIQDSSMVSINDSLILVLALQDKAKKLLEFNNLDIWATIQMDIDLEKQRLDAMQECVIILIHEYVMQATITKDLESRTTKKFLRNVKDTLKRLEDEYREECREVVKKLSKQNQYKLEQLRNKQIKQTKDVENSTKNMSKEEKKEVMKLIEQQHQTETGELTKLLKLQQDEELEKIRKEYAIKKRMALKGEQSATLDEIILQGELDEEQARGLLREHKSNVATLEKLMDEEVSRQRMLLEEKLSTRKAMAHASENQDQEQRNLLNMLASQTLSPIQELQKDDKVTQDEAHQYVERVKKEMLKAKDKLDSERKRQEQNLHKKLSDKKKRLLDEKFKEHRQQREKLEKGFKSNHEKDDIGCDDFLAANFTLMSNQREELFEIEAELDNEGAKELEVLRDELVEKTKEQIEGTKENIYKELMERGLTEEMNDEILEQHQRDVERLMEEREEQRQKQERVLKKKLAKHRKEWARKKEEEKVEQEQIREHEDKMVDKLLASQMAMSEEDRKRIMEEHEKQMVALENSLALNKLRQRRLLEEKLAVRKARQLQKMEQEHQGEALRQMRRAQLDSDEEDSAQDAQQQLMKKQVQEKIALLTHEDNDHLEEQQEQVHEEMVKERARSLQTQEEKIGALMAQLQLEKAREIATIEEQQKALWKLKLEMLDDMTEKGVVKNAECKKLVETHAKEVKQLENAIQSEQDRQEKELKKKLKMKMAEREKTFMERQERELEELAHQQTNGVAARLKRVALKHKHMVQMEEFRHKMEVELSQSVEELRRQSEVTRLRTLQNQELQFLSALVKQGHFDPAELRKVLQLLFPSKTDEDVQDMMATLYDKDKWDSEEENRASEDSGSQRGRNKKKAKKAGKNTSSLEDKVKAAIMGETLKTQTPESNPKTNKKPKKGKLAPLKSEQKNGDPFANTFSGPALPSINHRPEPVGRTASPSDDEEIDRRAKYDTDSEEFDDEEDDKRKKKKKIDYMY